MPGTVIPSTATKPGAPAGHPAKALMIFGGLALGGLLLAKDKKAEALLVFAGTGGWVAYQAKKSKGA